MAFKGGAIVTKGFHLVKQTKTEILLKTFTRRNYFQCGNAKKRKYMEWVDKPDSVP